MQLTMTNFDDRIRRYGKQQRLRHELMAMPNLAIELAELAKAGEINEDDAEEIYATYIKESTGLKPIRANPSFRVNVSKLRQIIRCKSPALLKRVAKLHNDRRGERLRPLYHCMVDAARICHMSGKAPSERQLLMIVTRKRTD